MTRQVHDEKPADSASAASGCYARRHRVNYSVESDDRSAAYAGNQAFAHPQPAQTSHSCSTRNPGAGLGQCPCLDIERTIARAALHGHVLDHHKGGKGC